jgi:hypothetical protein
MRFLMSLAVLLGGKTAHGGFGAAWVTTRKVFNMVLEVLVKIANTWKGFL